MPILTIPACISKLSNEEIGVVAPISPEIRQNLERWQVTECELRFNDGRTINTEQRKKIYATMNDISYYTGFTTEEVKANFKYLFIAETGCNYFSLSDVDMTTASKFLTYLIDFCLEWDIPCSDNLIERSPDVARYIYKCLKLKKSCISGLRSELHHVDAVGMGRNRKDIIHLGMRVLPLTRIEHTEAHAMGNTAFCEKYHIFGIKLDEELCKFYRIKSE